ncbi:hypothetical protein D9M68_952940 [compost metagenome]
MPDADQAAQLLGDHRGPVHRQPGQQQVQPQVVALAFQLQALRYQLQLGEQAQQSAQYVGLGFAAHVELDRLRRSVQPGIAAGRYWCFAMAGGQMGWGEHGGVVEHGGLSLDMRQFFRFRREYSA